MPFYKKTPIIPHSSCPCIEHIPTNVGGRVIYKDVDLRKLELSPAEHFDLNSLLKANVPLEQVNPNILGKSVSSAQLDEIIDGLDSLTDNKE